MHLGKMNLRAGVSDELRDAVVAAIEEAEKGNRGEVRVHVERRCPIADPQARAEELFHRLGMGVTNEDTAVLLYVSLDDGEVAVRAGGGIEGGAEPGFWSAVIERITKGVQTGDLADALVHSIGRIGMLLRMHVPGDDASGDELPNMITTS